MINGKRYIGQKNFDNKYKWKSYIGSGLHFSKAVKKYGKENFIRNIVDFAYSLEELNGKEKSWIENYDAVESDCYYNMIEGGNTGNHLKIKNSIPVVCISNNFVFKSISDACLWSGYTSTYIKKTYKKKHKLNNDKERLIFRPLNHVKEKSALCSICGKNFKKRNNVHKKCDKCSSLKGKLIINHDFKRSEEIGIEISKLTDGWVIRKIDLNDKMCKGCGLFFEKTKKYQRKCNECQIKKDKENTRLKKKTKE